MFVRQRSIILVVLLGLVAGGSAPRAANAQTDTTRRITFTPGMRFQIRDTYDNLDGVNDFFIARTRLKGKGNVFGIADYYGEVKIDNVGRFGRGLASVEVENAWLEFPLTPVMALRVGQYDVAFSRNALTSDSKLLLVDRSLIKDALTSLGMADNTAGLLLHGRPRGGRIEYATGLFDNLRFNETGTATARRANGPMVMGRMVYHLLDPAPRSGYADYQSSYIGQGRRLAIGANAGHLSKARRGSDEFNVTVWGADVFFNARALTLEAEHDVFVESRSALTDTRGSGWYAQGGYMVHPVVEVVSRFQRLDTDDVGTTLGNTLRWTSVGFNTYIRAHSLKVQTEYTFKRERLPVPRNDAFQVQLQLDF